MIKQILFNTDMVEAIIEDRKTETRRVIKLPHCGYFEHIPPLGVVPPYRTGDILYVRETWAEYNHGYLYKAWVEGNHQPRTVGLINWRPSIHMPKEAARIWLKVTDVRVERLQDMDLNDFLDEGVVIRPEAFNDPENAYGQAKEQFVSIWDSTIKKADKSRYSWEANPWVWAIKFERCGKPERGVI